MDEFDEINQAPEPTPTEPVPTPEPEYRAPAAPASQLYDPSQDERTFATLAHALQIPGWWIAPLIILLTKKDSRFVKFHATQALVLQALHFAVTVTTMVIVFAVMFGSITRVASGGSAKPATPTALFVAMPFIWLIMFGMWVLILVLSIMYAIKAGKGEWADYPFIGHLARYMLNL